MTRSCSLAAGTGRRPGWSRIVYWRSTRTTPGPSRFALAWGTRRSRVRLELQEELADTRRLGVTGLELHESLPVPRGLRGRREALEVERAQVEVGFHVVRIQREHREQVPLGRLVVLA